MDTEDNEKELSFFEKIWHFSRTKEVKEIFALHLGIITLGSLIYLLFSLEISVVFFVAALLLEMFVLHVTWIYRDNKDKDNPIRYAVIKESINTIVAVIGIVVFILVNNLVYSLTGVSIFIPVAILGVLSFFGYSMCLVFVSEVTEEDLEDLE